MSDPASTTSCVGSLSAAQFFCAELLAAWHSVPPTSRPPHVWLRQHAPFDYRSNVHRIPSPVLGAWLLTDGHIEERSISEFLRFYVVQGDRVWSSTDLPPPSPLFGRGAHEFALSAFAGILGTDDYYFEWQFAGLHGRGTRYHLEGGIFQPTETLWIS